MSVPPVSGSSPSSQGGTSEPVQVYPSIQELEFALEALFNSQGQSGLNDLSASALSSAIIAFYNECQSIGVSNLDPQALQLYDDITAAQAQDGGNSFYQMAQNFQSTGKDDFQWFTNGDDNNNPLWVMFNQDLPAWFNSNGSQITSSSYQSSISPQMLADLQQFLKDLSSLNPGNQQDSATVTQLAQDIEALEKDLGSPVPNCPICQLINNMLNAPEFPGGQSLLQLAQTVTGSGCTQQDIDALGGDLASISAYGQQLLGFGIAFGQEYPPAS